MVGAPNLEAVRRRLAWLAVVPLSLAGGLAGVVLIAPLRRMWGEFQDDCFCEVTIAWWEHVMYGAITTAMTTGALAFALSSREGVGSKAARFCLTFGWLNSPACLFAWTATHTSTLPDAFRSILWSPVLGAILGIFFALPLGAFYGLALAPAMSRIGALRRRPTLDAPARATRWIALTVAGVMLLVGALAATQDAPPIPPPLLLMLTIGAIAVAIAAELSLHRTRRFLARVSSGEEPGWVLSRHPRSALPELLAIPADLDVPAGLLLERTVDGPLTYRTPQTRVFWAISESPGNEATDEGV